MHETDPLWQIERDFWLLGASHFARTMADGCLMALPDPVGVLGGPQVLESLEGVPRWVTVELTDTHLSSLGDVGVLAYRVAARREGQDKPYRALCSSTYVRANGQWLMVQHQQTPL